MRAGGLRYEIPETQQLISYRFLKSKFSRIIMFTMSFKTKPLLLGLITGLLFMLILAELLSLMFSHPTLSEWTVQEQKERAAVEMHAEDIWRNRRSTLKSFDPLACSAKLHHEWRNTWHEVTCMAEDDKGQIWQYITRYGIRSSYFVSWIPFVQDTRPARQLTLLTQKTTTESKTQ